MGSLGIDCTRGALGKGRAVVASGLQVAEIVDSDCSAHPKSQYFPKIPWKEKKNQITMFRRMFIFSLKPLEGKLPP